MSAYSRGESTSKGEEVVKSGGEIPVLEIAYRSWIYPEGGRRAGRQDDKQT